MLVERREDLADLPIGLLDDIAAQSGFAAAGELRFHGARDVWLEQSDVEEKRLVLVGLDEGGGLGDHGIGQLLVDEARRLAAGLMADAADAVVDAAGVLLIGELPQELGAIESGGFVADVFLIADLDGIGRVEIDDVVVLDPDAGDTVHGCGDDVAIVEANFQRPGFDFTVEIETGFPIAQAEVPLADDAGLIAGVFQQGGESELPWLHGERRVAVQNRVASCRLPPRVIAGQQRIAAGRASGGGRIGGGEELAGLRERINRRRLDHRGSVAAEIAVAKVVGDDD